MIAGLPQDAVVCPRCHSTLDRRSESGTVTWVCRTQTCPYHAESFPVIDGVPALIDFENSVLTRDQVCATAGASTKDRAPPKSAVLRTLKELMRGRSRTPQNTDRFIKSISPKAERASVLVIGGGVPGRGTEALYSHPQIDLVCTDIYVTPDTVALADGHALPFKSESFDGVWIQAVLEHVLEPQRVVDEIHRVLKPEGIVYAQTPFMAQVHEAAYDFTRFTVSGHRWLFRRFSEINAGIARGPGTVLTWSVRYFVAAVFRSYRVGTVAAFLVSWVQFFDRFVDPKFAWDGPSGTFFLGRKSERAITRQEIIKFYKGAQ